MSNKYFLTSDLHLGNLKDSPIFHEIALNFAKWLKAQMIEKNVNKLIIAGDFLHSRTSVALPTLHVAHEFLDILSEFEVYLSTGNHDSWLLDNSDITSLSAFKNRTNVHVIDKLTTMGPITYCPWGTAIKDLPDFSPILIGHWDVISFAMSKGKIATHGLRANDIMERCNVAFSGHFHTPQERLYDGKPFRFLGSPYQLNFGESGNNNVVYILDTETLEIEKIKNTISPRFEYIRSDQDFDKIKGNFVAVQIPNSDEGEKLLHQIESYSPLNIKTLIQEKDNNVLTNDVEEFKVVDIEQVIVEFVKNMPDFDDIQKAEILKLSTNLYKKFN